MAGGIVGAFFDIDGTLAATNLVDSYLAFMLRGRSAPARLLRLQALLPWVPYYALVDKISRAHFNRVFFARYRGVALERLHSWAEEAGRSFWSSRIYSQALQEVRWHHSRPHKIALVTGGIREMAQPLSEAIAADGLIAAEMESQGGRLTGRLSSAPLAGQAKADAAMRLADTLGVDLGRSYAYADSYSDREFLECVANPVAVNPDRRLRKLARDRGWEIRTWRSKGWIDHAADEGE